MRSWTVFTALVIAIFGLACSQKPEPAQRVESRDQNSTPDKPTTPRPGSRFDAASFGIVDASKKSYGIRWGEPRKIRNVEVEFEPGAKMPAPDKVRVQYWQSI